MNIQVDSKKYEELWKRVEMLSDIALSAAALKLMIEHGFEPHLDALDRDLSAYQERFGAVCHPLISEEV